MRRFLPVAAVVLFVVICIAVFSTPSIGQQQKGLISGKTTLTIGLNASYPPFADWSSGAPKGLDVQLAKMLAQSVGLDPEKDVTFVPVKPDEAAKAVSEGKIDVAIAALSLTPDRLRLAASSNLFYLAQRLRVGKYLRISPIASSLENWVWLSLLNSSTNCAQCSIISSIVQLEVNAPSL